MLSRADVVAWALVDPSDVEILSRSTWSLSSNGYAVSSQGELMHRVLLGARPGDPLVDHENRIRIDNRRSNLRFSTPLANARNRTPRAALSPLGELRIARGATQAEVAAAVGSGQSRVSQLEACRDPKVSTVRAHVEGLGGELRFAAVFDDTRFPLAL